MGGLSNALVTTLLLTTTLAPMFCPTTSRAQFALDQDAEERRVGRARTLFADGAAAATEGRYDQAARYFREALELHDAPTIRYNLASVLFELGSYPEAYALAGGLISSSDSPDDIREHARELRSHVDERAGYARITLDGEARVEVDGYVLPDVTARIPLAPGEHTARAMDGAVEIASRTFEITAGETASVSLDAGVEEEGPARPVTEEWWFWAAIGGGGAIVLGVIIGVAVYAATSSPQTVEAPIEGDFDPAILRF